MQEGLLIVISGPSGVGKNTIINSLFDKLPNLNYSISATTRNPRPNETDGQHYFFLSEADFLQKINDSEFLEWAKVYQYYYGTPKDTVFQILKRGNDVILDVDVQGALQIKRAFSKAVLIFLAPPSIRELKNRLIGRRTEQETQVAERLKYITKEFRCAPEYDYLVVNQEINLTCSQIECIILAEKCRISRLEKDCLDIILNDQ
jgi:guanylate kinase